MVAQVAPTDRSTTTVPALEIHALTKEYGGVPVFRGLDLAVPAGGSLAVAGPRGAGKTTLLGLAAGLIRPTWGTVRVGGIDPVRSPERLQKHVGLMFVEPSFYGWLTGREALLFKGRFARSSAGRSERRCRELLTIAGLEGAADERVECYSAAMRRRLAIVQALGCGPDVLLLDEPAASFEGPDRLEVLKVIERLRGVTTVVFTTDRLSDADSTGAGAVLIHDGRVGPAVRTSG